MEHGPAAVSIAHGSGAYADGMATALIILGSEDGFALAGRLDLAILYIERGDERFETRQTPRFEQMTHP